MSAHPQLRPLSLGEKIDAGFKLWTRNFRELTIAALLFTAPMAVLSTLIQTSIDPDAFDPDEQSGIGGLGSTDEDLSTDEALRMLGGTLANLTLTVAATTLATAAVLKLVGDAYTGHRVDWRASVRFAMRRLFPLLGLLVLTWLGILGALVVSILALGIAGVWLYVAWSVSQPALLLEDARVVESLRRSFRLVRHHWWATFGTLIVGFLLVTVIQLPLGAVMVGVFAAVDNELAIAIVSTLTTIVSYAISLPLGAAIVVLIYVDLRIRKEGFDLQLLAQQIGHSGAGPDIASAPWAQPAPTWSPQPPAGWQGGQPGGRPAGQGGWGQGAQMPPGYAPPSGQAYGPSPAQAGGWRPAPSAPAAGAGAPPAPERPQPPSPPRGAPPGGPADPGGFVPPSAAPPPRTPDADAGEDSGPLT